MTSSQLLDLVVASLEELKNDTVILECYKKVVDIEIPKDAVNEAYDSFAEFAISIDNISKELENLKDIAVLN